MQAQVPKLAEYISLALRDNYFITILISSRTKGKFKSTNLPFGLGKTTLALWVSYLLNGQSWKRVFENLCYYPNEVVKLLIPGVGLGNTKRNCIIWDDVQFTCPSSQGIPSPIRRLSGYLTTNRPECSVLILTAPGFNDINVALRRLVIFEMIVFERGKYEVQQIIRHKNFHKPTEDKEQLLFVEGENQHLAYLPLPPDIQKQYDVWRAEKKRPFAEALVRDLDDYVQEKMMQDVTPEEVHEAAKIIGNYSRKSRGKAA